MATAKATLDWHLWIHCPECDETIDLADVDDGGEGTYSDPIFNNRWDDLKGETVDCPECKCEFEIAGVEY